MNNRKRWTVPWKDSQTKPVIYHCVSRVVIQKARLYNITYDPVYGRIQTMTDGIGLTTYAFHPVDGTTLGAGNLHTIDGPLANDTIAHTYDALGRMKTRSINGVANTTTVNTYDALGRVESLTNPLGTFQHTYGPVNLLPKTVSAPNGLTTTFDYHTATADLRLKEIKNHLNGNAPLSTHGYIYSPEGNIKSWSQTTGINSAKTWGVAYDRADQLEAATLTNSSAVVQEHHAWRYDKIGNRTSRQNGPQITQTTHNNRNQITSEEPGGWMRVRGTTDEGASVRVKSNSNPFTNAATTSANEFSAWVRSSPGANSVTIEATDYASPTPRTTSKSWSVNITGQSRVPSYDLNGNTETNGSGHTYQWDAENRLVKITYADNSSTEFQYDGLSRRARITEKTASNTITSDKRYLWAGGNQPAEERDAAGTIVLKQYHPQGEFIPAATAPLNKLFFSHDHLGSVRELVDANGTLQTRYDYDMWGKRVKLSGTVESDVGYTGHHHHAKSGLILTWYRAYDAQSGRWLSADPMGEAGGLNLYAYVGGNPINAWDPLGLDPTCNFMPTPVNPDGSRALGISRENYLRYAKAISPKKGEFHILAHGRPFIVYDDRLVSDLSRPAILPKELVEKMKRDYQKEWEAADVVVLHSCETGKGANSFAEQVAKESGKIVKAPTDILTTSGKIKGGGSWRKFPLPQLPKP
jgi:RHS repeat-associated protein